MMNRRFYSICAATLAAALLLIGCGGSSNSYSTDQKVALTSVASSSMAAAPAAAEMPMEAFDRMGILQNTNAKFEGGGEIAREDSASEQETTAPPVLDQRKIIKRSNLSLQTKEFDTAFAQILALVEQAGGYIEGQDIDSGSLDYRSYYERHANIRARVPSEKLDEVVDSIGGVCNISNRSEQMEDITDQYYDVQAHLDSLSLQEERLLDILSKAEKLEEVITLEQALSEVRYQIESLTASLRRMNSQVTYSYLNMDLHEVVEYDQTPNAPKTFGERLQRSFNRGGEHLVDFVQGSILFIAECAPVLLVLVIGVAILALVVIKLNKFRHNRKAAQYSNSSETDQSK